MENRHNLDQQFYATVQRKTPALTPFSSGGYEVDTIEQLKKETEIKLRTYTPPQKKKNFKTLLVVTNISATFLKTERYLETVFHSHCLLVTLLIYKTPVFIKHFNFCSLGCKIQGRKDP